MTEPHSNPAAGWNRSGVFETDAVDTEVDRAGGNRPDSRLQRRVQEDPGYASCLLS